MNSNHHQHNNMEEHHHPPVHHRPPPQHGVGGGGTHHHQHRPPEVWIAYKVLIDPIIHRGSPKMVRYDGTIVPGDPHHLIPTVSDPRVNKMSNSLWKRFEPMELTVPKFKVDEHYVGDPPKVEVTIENLNDNVGQQFLHGMIIKCGEYEEMCIHYHPITGKHLGLARVVFKEVKSAKECVRLLHGKSVMGQQLNCYLDPRGASCQKMYEELTAEKVKPEPPPPPVLAEPTLAATTSDSLSIPPTRVTSQDESPLPGMALSADDEFSGRQRQTGYWADHDDETRHGSRQESRNADYRDRPTDRWPSSSRDSRERHRDRRDRDEVEGNDRYDHLTSRHSSYDDQSASAMNDPSRVGLNKYDPSYAEPDYWQQQAKMYALQQAAAAAAAAAVAAGNVPSVAELLGDTSPATNDDVEEAVGETVNGEAAIPSKGDDQVIDLDTRLKLLMKDRTGAMPAFLLQELENSGSDNEADKEVSKVLEKSPVDDPDAPLSRPPSPFLSAEHYHANLRSRKKARVTKNRASSQNSDRMSLSSLSSGENNILQQQQQQQQLPYPPPYGHYSYYGQPPLPGQPLPPPPPPGFPPPNGWNGLYPHGGQYGNYAPPPGAFPGYFPPPGYPGGAWGGDSWQTTEDNDYYAAVNKPPKSDKNVCRRIIDETIKSFVEELKRALAKDIQKKICETYTFNLYEEWWQEQERKYKEKQARLAGNKKPITSQVPPVGVPPTMAALQAAAAANKENTSANVASSSSVSAVDSSAIKMLPRIPKAEELSNMFDQRRVNPGFTGLGAFGAGGSLGFGFRGTIPKLPSFKRKTAQPAVSSRRSDGISSDDESKPRSSSSGKRKSASERRRDHEQRREERISGKDRRRQKREEEKKESSKVSKEKPSKTSVDKRHLDEVESESRISSKVSSPIPPTEASSTRKTSTQSSTSDTDLSDTSLVKSPVRPKRRQKTKKSSSEEEKTKAASSDDESSTSVHSSRSSTKSVDKTKTDKKRASPSASSSAVSSAASSSASSSSSSSASSSSSSESSSEVEVSSAESSSSGDEALLREPVVKSQKKPVRRASAVLAQPEVVDDLANGELLEDESRIESPAYMTDHCYARPISESKKRQAEEFESQFANDHGYTRPRTPPSAQTAELPKAPVPKKDLVKPKKSVTLPPPPPSYPVVKKTFPERTKAQSADLLYKFLFEGVDFEDVKFFQLAYQIMLKNDQMSNVLNSTHWVDHPATYIPPTKRRRSDNDFSRPHMTGSCRTEGYYKMDPREKRRTKYHLQRPEAYEAISQQYRYTNTEGAVTKAKLQTSQSQSREARSTQRRQLAVLGEEALNSDLLKFNQLKFRRKQLSFGKSAIHDWGLFAREDIGADEMVIEYVGHVIRPLIADVWEKRYEKQGIGSSYLFRIDQDYVVDATKRGNLARFINHSCDPNCYAKIITIDGEKKIVIYSKQPIAFGEEITYDYKFPIEDEKILCLCGAKNCRKYLN